MLNSLIGILARRRPPVVTGNPQITATDSQSGTGSTSHNLTGVPAGALLVLSVQAETHSNNAVISSSPSLIWTKRADASAVNSGDAEIYTAVFTAGGNITVNSTFTVFRQTSVLYSIINADTNFSGAANAVRTLQSAPLATLTTTRANSILIAVTSDWNAINGASRVYRNSPTETKYDFLTGAATAYHYYKAAPTVTSYTLGLTAPVGQSSGTCVIEVRSLLAATPDTQAPTASVLTAPSAGATSINLSWTAGSDNVGIVGYDVYVNNNIVATVTTTSYTVTGLTSSTSYNIFVRSKDAAGNSTDSNTLVTSTTSQPPTANAGTDQIITLPTNSIVLNGSGNDPDGTISTYAWTKQSGGAATLSGAATANLSLSGLVQGTYVFRLTVTDNTGLTAFDNVTVTVNPAANQLPTANAGADRTITLPTNSTTLNGSGTDPDGSISAYLWTQLSGPNTATIVSSNAAVTALNNLVQGTYVFQLRVTDNSGGQATDTVSVVVNPSPVPTIVSVTVNYSDSTNVVVSQPNIQSATVNFSDSTNVVVQ